MNQFMLANVINDRTERWIWMLLALAVLFLLIVTIVLLYKRHLRIKQAKIFIRTATPQEKENYINHLIETSGFQYNAQKDIFYAMKRTWQKRYGYCRFYDDAAPLFGMIIDCEPIYFHYDDKKWLLELWKGQYGMTTGGEIGLYIATDRKENFYKGVDADNYIGMKMELFLRGVPLFERQENHWWLTGFRLGECTEPKELKMVVTLTFLNRLMCLKFVEGLRNAGYSENEYLVQNEKVKILFFSPHTSQPATRGWFMDHLRMARNCFLCRCYRIYTRKYATTSDKLIILEARAPRIFTIALTIGKPISLFERIRENENLL